jgi:hypothetical protein
MAWCGAWRFAAVIGGIERIVVSLDAVSDIHAAIAAAARLAVRWNAAFHGVFVEDEDLLRLAGLPFARQVSLGAGAEALTAAQAARQLRAFAETARRELAAAARRHDLRWSFEIVHGAAAVTTAAGDFIVACAASRPIGAHFRIDTQPRRAVAPGSGSLLLMHPVRAGRTVVTVLHDREPASGRVLEAAAQFAEAADASLVVVCASKLARDKRFEAWVGERLAAYSVHPRIESASGDPAALQRHILGLDCGLLALAEDADPVDRDRRREIATRTGCDILVMR